MKKLKIRSYYNNDYVDKPQEFVEPSLTQQRFFALNNIPTLLAQGILQTDCGIYGEQLNATYEDLLNEKIVIQRDFASLPIELQRKFQNASNYLKYISNPRNYDVKDPIDTPTVLPNIDEGKEGEEVE